MFRRNHPEGNQITTPTGQKKNPLMSLNNNFYKLNFFKVKFSMSVLNSLIEQSYFFNLSAFSQI